MIILPRNVLHEGMGGGGGFLPQGTASLKEGTKFPQPAKKDLLFTHLQPPFPSSGASPQSGRGGGQEAGDGANPNQERSRHSGACL